MKKINLIISFLFVSTLVFAQEIQITGTQTQKENTELKCNPVSLSKTMMISKIEGDCQGFWIVKNDKTIHKFNDIKSAENIELLPGKYYVYPYFKKGHKTASVTITLKIKPEDKIE